MEKAENLFLRPGYTAICEWGNAGYVNNKGDFIDVTSTENYGLLFKNDLKEVEKSLEQNRINSSFNYDAFIGFITNFSWSYQPDGSFNCSIKVLSKGTILESLKIDTGSDSSTTLNASRIEERFYTIEKPEEQNDNSSEATSSTDSELNQRRSLLDFFCFSTEARAINNENEFGGIIDYNNFKVFLLGSGREDSPLIEILKAEGITEEEFKVFGFDANLKSPLESRLNKYRYISLRTFLALVNASFISTDDETFPKFSIDYNDYKEYTTIDDHFSFDPSLVLLPKLPTSVRFNKKISTIRKEFREDSSIASRILVKSTTRVKNDNSLIPFTQVFINDTSENIINSIGETSDKNILNIFISTKLITTCLNRSFSSENIDTNTLFNFMKTVLTQINELLGGITQLDIHYDDFENKLTIVDRKQVGINLKPEEVQLINFTGIKNTVLSLEQETKLSAELTSQLAISANPNSTSSASGNINFSFYNQGKIDRFKKIDPPPTEEEERSQLVQKFLKARERGIKKQEKLENFVKNIFRAYMLFNNSVVSIGNNSVYDSKLFDKIRGEALSRVGDEADAINGPLAFIPFPLTIKIDGISGLKIGQVFKLGDSNNLSPVLPSIYNRIAFIITGLNSSIENGKWYTNIVALTYNLPSKRIVGESIFKG